MYLNPGQSHLVLFFLHKPESPAWPQEACHPWHSLSCSETLPDLDCGTFILSRDNPWDPRGGLGVLLTLPDLDWGMPTPWTWAEGTQPQARTGLGGTPLQTDTHMWTWPHVVPRTRVANINLSTSTQRPLWEDKSLCLSRRDWKRQYWRLAFVL